MPSPCRLLQPFLPLPTHATPKHLYFSKPSTPHSVPEPWGPHSPQLPLTLVDVYSFFKIQLSYQCPLKLYYPKCGLYISSTLSISESQPHLTPTESGICIKEELKEIGVYWVLRNTGLGSPVFPSARCLVEESSPQALLEAFLTRCYLLYISLCFLHSILNKFPEDQDPILFNFGDSVTLLVPIHSRCSINACCMNENQ